MCKISKNFDFDSRSILFDKCIEPKILVRYSQKNYKNAWVKMPHFLNQKFLGNFYEQKSKMEKRKQVFYQSANRENSISLTVPKVSA